MPERLVSWFEAASAGPWMVFLVLGWLAYVLVLGAWVVLQKREPVATLSWLLGLALLPYVGFLIYHVFGPQKIRRHRLRRSRSRSALPEDTLPLDGEAAEIARMVQAATRLPMTTATDVRLLVDGAAKFAALLQDIAGARRHVHLEYYIWAPDRTGAALRDALVARARAGVTVRLLVDAVGSASARKFFAPLLAVGGELAWFHPPRFGRIWTPTPAA